MSQLAFIVGLVDPRDEQLRWIGVARRPAELNAKLRFDSLPEGGRWKPLKLWRERLRELELVPQLHVFTGVRDGETAKRLAVRLVFELQSKGCAGLLNFGSGISAEEALQLRSVKASQVDPVLQSILNAQEGVDRASTTREEGRT